VAACGLAHSTAVTAAYDGGFGVYKLLMNDDVIQCRPSAASIIIIII